MAGAQKDDFRFSSLMETTSELAKAYHANTPEKILDNECITRIMKDALNRLKISLLLPQILKNPLSLEIALHGTDYEKAYYIVKRFIGNRLTREKLDELRRVRRMRKRRNKAEPYEFPEPEITVNLPIIKLVDYFHTHSKIHEYFPNWLTDLNEYNETLLKSMELLYDATMEHLKYSAADKLVLEKRLHALYHKKNGLKKEVMETEAQLKSLKSRARWKAGARSALIQNYVNKLNVNANLIKDNVKKETKQLNRSIRQINNHSVAKKRELEEELEGVSVEYAQQAREDGKNIKNALDEKNRYQIQLQAILTKYDTNIYEKFHENLYLQDQFDEAKKEFDEFMVGYRAEEEIYNMIVVKRREEEQALLDAKLMVFMFNRAATKIQRWLRGIWRKEKIEAGLMKVKKSKSKHKQKDKGKGKAKPKGKGKA